METKPKFNVGDTAYTKGGLWFVIQKTDILEMKQGKCIRVYFGKDKRIFYKEKNLLTLSEWAIIQSKI